MREWIIELEGRAPDLEGLVGLRDGDAGWWIERDDRRGVVLRSTRLDALEDRSEVHGGATKLLGHIDSAARRLVHRFGGVALADCVLILDGQEQFPSVGGKNVAHLDLPAPTMKAYGAGVGPPPAPDGTPPSPREYEHWEILRQVALQEAHPDLADAHRYLRDEPGMQGYYKAAEAIRAAVGGKWNMLVSLGWTTDAELRRFRQSAQPQRHHKGRAPDNPFTEARADTFVRDLLDKLIASVTFVGPPAGAHHRARSESTSAPGFRPSGLTPRPLIRTATFFIMACLKVRAPMSVFRRIMSALPPATDILDKAGNVSV